jgi:cephalosporin hydroxylase
MSLYHDYKTNQGKKIHKWDHFFPIYERHFSSWKNKSLTLFEIGVQNGGSAQMWKRYLGPLCTVVGIDIDPECKTHEERNLYVRIGNQSDKVFLSSVLDEFGCPDIVIDDGSHNSSDIIASMQVLYPKLTKNGVYLVEDTMCSYYPEFNGGVENTVSFINKSKDFIDQLYDEYILSGHSDSMIYNQTFSIAYYPGIVVFEKMQYSGFKTHEMIGGIGNKTSKITRFKKS